MPGRSHHRHGFTVTELLIVIAVVIVLLGFLLPALSSVWSQGEMAKSMSNLRQIATWMTEYSRSNREQVLPSQFNYASDPYKGKVRTDLNANAVGSENAGTWSDILWSQFFTQGEIPGSGSDNNYRHDSADKYYYDVRGKGQPNPFRSAAVNTEDVTGGSGPRPFGDGARQSGYPGFFAANNFFNADETSTTYNGWFSTGQLPFPDQSMYLVDSYYGEVIEDECPPFDAADGTIEVDFRYNEVCLMLFLDGHTSQEGRWEDLDDLEGYVDGTTGETFPGRSIRVRELTTPELPPACSSP